MRSPIIPICFRSLGLRKRAKYWAFRLISVLYFPLGNMFCSNKITLAFRWRPWVNSRDTTGLSVASAIKSSRMMMLLYRVLISHRHTDLQTVRAHLFPIGCFFRETFSTFHNILAIDCSTLLLFIHDTIVFQNLLDKIRFPTAKSEILWRKLNSGHGLVTMDAVTFRAAFVGCRTEQVFLRTHLISSTVCVGHAGSFPSSPYKWCTWGKWLLIYRRPGLSQTGQSLLCLQGILTLGVLNHKWLRMKCLETLIFFWRGSM